MAKIIIRAGDHKRRMKKKAQGQQEYHTDANGDSRPIPPASPASNKGLASKVLDLMIANDMNTDPGDSSDGSGNIADGIWHLEQELGITLEESIIDALIPLVYKEMENNYDGPGDEYYEEDEPLGPEYQDYPDSSFNRPDTPDFRRPEYK
jgi:hypothetical protein